jgi:hypothetical protein
MTVRQLQAEPHDRLSKSFKGASFRIAELTHGRSAARICEPRPGQKQSASRRPQPMGGGLARWKTVDYKSALQPAACEKGIIAMSHQVKIVSALLGCAAAMLAVAAAPANATVYNVNRTIDGGSVIGTITTDGATGTINPSDFIAWDLQLSSPDRR